MKKILFLLCSLLITTFAFAHRCVKMPEIKNIPIYMCDIDSINDAIQYTQIEEINEVYTSVTYITKSHSLVFVYLLDFDAAVELYMNQKYILYKMGYISKEQFCVYKKEYKRLYNS